MGQLTQKDVIRQSETAFKQSGEKWKKWSKLNGERYKKDGNSFADIYLTGYGKQLVVVAMGQSLEDNLDALKKCNNNENVDVVCCDKAFKVLIENDINVKYVFLADANIDYEEWLKPVLHKTSNITLIASICSNPKWSKNWLGKVIYFVNKDSIKSEKIFSEISGCNDLIPASSNVGNSAVVFSTQILGYDEYLLVGYDYGWYPQENYYAFNNKDKRFWMKTRTGFDFNGNLAYTSENLLFSCNWLKDYYEGPIVFNKQKMFNCSNKGFLEIPHHDLFKRIKKFKPKLFNENIKRNKKMFKSKKININRFNDDGKSLNNILKNKDILNIDITYCEKEPEISWV